MSTSDLHMYSAGGSFGPLSTKANILISALTLFVIIRNATHPARLVRYITGKVRQRYRAWQYLFNAPQMIQEEFDKSNGKPFELFAPDNRYVFVSDPAQIKEIDAAPESTLSLRAASKQMLQPQYTMHGFNWFDNRQVEGLGIVRAMRTLLTRNIPQVLPELTFLNRQKFAELLADHAIVDGVKLSPVYPMISKMVVLNHAVAFFGMELAKDEDFLKSALGFIEETIICAELVRLVPTFLAPLIGTLISKTLKSHKKFYGKLLPEAEQRVRERDLARAGHTVPKHQDCIQWVLETSPKANPWSAERVVKELLAIWFGSNHALSTTISFAIHDLCLHPEYAAPLRAEVAAGYADFERTGNGLPLLDSFIKESARLTPAESMSTRRQALQDFTLSNGTTVSVGEWFCTPVRAIMRDAAHYPDPDNFSGFRFAPREVIPGTPEFADKPVQESPVKMTDLGESWHVWGTGKMACPGRFYATAVMKVILAQVVSGYECRLAEPEKVRTMSWRSYTLPTKDSMVVFTPVEGAVEV